MGEGLYGRLWCGGPTDLCIKQPGSSVGYCIQCSSTGVCHDAGAPVEDWTCNAVFTCLIPSNTWCGPYSEIEESSGFLIECT